MSINVYIPLDKDAIHHFGIPRGEQSHTATRPHTSFLIWPSELYVNWNANTVREMLNAGLYQTEAVAKRYLLRNF